MTARTGERSVGYADAEMRLDRWFLREFPQLSFGQVARLLRTGQIRVDGRRAKPNQRLEAGQQIRIPPQVEAGSEAARAAPVPPRPAVAEKDAAWLKSLILHQDRDVIVFNKPAGVAVQGGERVARHIDGLLDALAEGGERPRLVHRLDRDTSGLLVVARRADVARALARAFQGKEARKLYWAAVVGVPQPREGTIRLALAKKAGARQGEAMAPDPEGGKRAVTLYRTIDELGGKVAWLALQPLTGRTHQLRVHAKEIGTPILGDGKYAGRDAFLGDELAHQLHLHARRLVLPLPSGKRLDLTAPLPPHMARTWSYLGFDDQAKHADSFLEDAAGWVRP